MQGRAPRVREGDRARGGTRAQPVIKHRCYARGPRVVPPLIWRVLCACALLPFFFSFPTIRTWLYLLPTRWAYPLRPSLLWTFSFCRAARRFLPSRNRCFSIFIMENFVHFILEIYINQILSFEIISKFEKGAALIRHSRSAMIWKTTTVDEKSQ